MFIHQKIITRKQDEINIWKMSQGFLLSEDANLSVDTLFMCLSAHKSVNPKSRMSVITQTKHRKSAAPHLKRHLDSSRSRGEKMLARGVR